MYYHSSPSVGKPFVDVHMGRGPVCGKFLVIQPAAFHLSKLQHFLQTYHQHRTVPQIVELIYLDLVLVCCGLPLRALKFVPSFASPPHSEPVVPARSMQTSFLSIHGNAIGLSCLRPNVGEERRLSFPPPQPPPKGSTSCKARFGVTGRKPHVADVPSAVTPRETICLSQTN